MRIAHALLILLACGACATPRESCLRSATSELATLNRLVAESEANLSRGYALNREAEVVSVVDFCFGNRRGHVGYYACTRPQTRYRTTRVAIDPAAEQRKLANLKSKQADANRRASAAVNQCNATYPAS